MVEECGCVVGNCNCLVIRKSVAANFYVLLSEKPPRHRSNAIPNRSGDNH
jgi:hypothetical protein